MADVLDVLHARWAEAAAEALLAGEEHPRLVLTTQEAAAVIDHITDLRQRYSDLELEYHEIDFQQSALRRAAADAGVAFDRIQIALAQRTAHPEAQVRQAQTIARRAAESLAAANSSVEETPQ
ncbi:hypothetical protein VMT65_31050 [Nocardia sp. CDC153]|uniref:hypothetical protein n=1 Tax=Nocardia sp. CDC153 TaxID=3112167 RepID=UPI002DBC0FB4|nr:hypothetical protein [Nocardia sp. CDC153]MEC3957507.1 hypothetical protein [Nocardia sp. CDC153]